MKTPDQKRQSIFVHDLCKNIMFSLLETIESGRVPAEWDGHELRVWIADRFKDSADMSVILKHPRQARARRYRNAVIIHNL